MPAPSQCARPFNPTSRLAAARHPLACYDQAATSTEDSECAGPAWAPGSLPERPSQRRTLAPVRAEEYLPVVRAR